MSAVLDHPDIEKLPLEVDGIPVRETIREIFRNPDHGTPDNISKVGCLALAKKSNEAGGRDRGYVVWNEWTKLNPNIFIFRSWVDFSGINFQSPSPNFSNFIFGGNANFENTQFGDNAKFQAAEFGAKANFKNAQFGDHANFQGAEWEHHANFQCAQFGSSARFAGARWGIRSNFSGAQWGQWADFKGAQWGHYPQFLGAQWGIWTDFSFAHWGEGAGFQGARWAGRASFQGTYWESHAHFQSGTWSQVKSIYADEALYQTTRNFSDANNASPFELPESDFSGATFLGPIDFSGRQFKTKTRFGLLPEYVKRVSVKRDENGNASFDENGNVVFEEDRDQHRHSSFGAAPIFHGCELHQDTSFEGAQFPPASGSEEAARAYRTLKLAFSKQQSIREEQRFFRLEMEEETLRETGLKRWLFQKYKQLSDYGFSVMLPITYLVLAPLFLMALLYGVLVEVYVLSKYEWLQDIPTLYFWSWLKWSLTSGLPIPGIDTSKELRICLFGSGTGLSVLAIILEMLHKILTLAGLFLSGLALRNLFKLK